MRLNWKFLGLAMLTAVALSLAGCGGVNAGGNVSPLMFFMKNTPPPTTGAPNPAIKPVTQLAQAR